MDLTFRFDWWYSRLPASPLDHGRVHRIVLRPPGSERGTRVVPESAELVPGQGLLGDKWEVGEESAEHADPEGAEVSLMNVHVLRSLAGGDEDRMALSGDNLQVDLDLTEANLPVGTRLTIGEVVLVVSAQPHRPCRHFHDRFGADGAKKVARANRVGRRGRGVMCTIERGGTIHVNDTIDVQRPSGHSSKE